MKNTKNKGKTLFTPERIAKLKLIPFSSRTIRRLIAAGKIRAVNTSNAETPRYIVTESEIERLKKASKSRV
jgi:predicted site-specific integrase-resolvase